MKSSTPLGNVSTWRETDSNSSRDPVARMSMMRLYSRYVSSSDMSISALGAGWALPNRIRTVGAQPAPDPPPAANLERGRKQHPKDRRVEDRVDREAGEDGMARQCIASSKISIIVL